MEKDILVRFVQVVLIILISSCSQDSITLPEGQDISKESAKRDIHGNIKFYWLEYGELNNYRCKEEIRNRYGLEIYQVTGCEITNNLIQKIEEYNTEIDKYMKDVYDKDWKTKLLSSDLDCSRVRLEKSR